MNVETFTAEEAMRLVNKLKKASDGDGVDPDHMALIHMGLGDNDKAFEFLEEAVDKRVWYLVFLNADPMFGPLRGDPRFARLVRKVGLPKASS